MRSNGVLVARVLCVSVAVALLAAPAVAQRLSDVNPNWSANTSALAGEGNATFGGAGNWTFGTDLTWFTNRNAFEVAAAAAGKTLLGIEDYEASTLPNNAVDGFNDPLEFGIPNLPDGFPYPNGTDGLAILVTQSNILGANGTVPSPRVLNALVAASNGFLGITTDVMLANTFVDSLDLIFTSADTTAIGGRVVDVLGAQVGVVITVYDTNNVRIGQRNVPGDARGSSFMGVISTVPIGRINMFSDGAEGLDDIQAWEGGDPPCVPCDMNCDTDINALDIEPFIGLLFNGDDPCCGNRGDIGSTGDVNLDGSIDALDIEGFINCLFP